MAKICCKSDFIINQAKECNEEDCEVLAELARLIEHEEKEIQPHKKLIKVINLGSDEVRREVKIGAFLVEHVQSELIKLIHEYVDVFA